MHVSDVRMSELAIYCLRLLLLAGYLYIFLSLYPQQRCEDEPEDCLWCEEVTNGGVHHHPYHSAHCKWNQESTLDHLFCTELHLCCSNYYREPWSFDFCPALFQWKRIHRGRLSVPYSDRRVHSVPGELSPIRQKPREQLHHLHTQVVPSLLTYEWVCLWSKHCRKIFKKCNLLEFLFTDTETVIAD